MINLILEIHLIPLLSPLCHSIRDSSPTFMIHFLQEKRRNSKHFSNHSIKVSLERFVSNLEKSKKSLKDSKHMASFWKVPILRMFFHWGEVSILIHSSVVSDLPSIILSGTFISKNSLQPLRSISLRMEKYMMNHSSYSIWLRVQVVKQPNFPNTTLVHLLLRMNQPGNGYRNYCKISIVWEVPISGSPSILASIFGIHLKHSIKYSWMPRVVVNEPSSKALMLQSTGT